MHFLGVPTTRALSCTVSTDTVNRDLKYDGNVKKEKCAVVIRLSPTFIRFGSFQLKLKDAYNPKRGGDIKNFDIGLISELADYTLKYFYPQFNGLPRETAYASMLREITKRTMELFVKWQAFGFIHGVLNTDNMSILGLTIDYGPYGFMEYFDNFMIINTSDEWGRYAYKNQPAIAKWNLDKLYECFEGLIPTETLSTLKKELEGFEKESKAKINRITRKKLGLLAEDESADNPTLVSTLIDRMNLTRVDWTNFFFALDSLGPDMFESKNYKPLLAEFAKHSPSNALYLQSQKTKFPHHILESVLANPMMQMSLSMQLGFFPEEYFQDQLERTQVAKETRPMQDNEWREFLASKWADWIEIYHREIAADKDRFVLAKRGSAEEYWKERERVLRENNPAYILRNHHLQKAIEKAEQGDYTEVERLLDLCTRPFDRSIPASDRNTPTECTGEICLSCSS